MDFYKLEKLLALSTSIFMVCLQICKFTNDTAVQRKAGETSRRSGYGPWKTLQVDELKAFYGLRSFIEMYCKDR